MKTTLATLVGTALLTPTAWAGGVAHEVRVADRVIGTPGGLVTITGRTVKLWSSADADGRVLDTLQLPAGARVAYGRGRALAVSYEPSSSPLAPGQTDSGYGERLRPLSIVQIINHKLRFLRKVKPLQMGQEFCNEGRGIVRRYGADSAEIENLETGKSYRVQLHLEGADGKPLTSVIEQTPQLVAPDRFLWPLNNVLFLIGPKGHIIWKSDDEQGLIGRVAVSDDGRLALLARSGGFEVRRISDGRLVWSGGRLEPLVKKVREYGRVSVSRVDDIETTPTGWIVTATTSPGGGLMAEVSCRGDSCTVSLLAPDTLRGERVYDLSVGRRGSYTVDMATGKLLRKDATGWDFVSEGA
jgi:hypothetical protein